MARLEFDAGSAWARRTAPPGGRGEHQPSQRCRDRNRQGRDRRGI